MNDWMSLDLDTLRRRVREYEAAESVFKRELIRLREALHESEMEVARLRQAVEGTRIACEGHRAEAEERAVRAEAVIAFMRDNYDAGKALDASFAAVDEEVSK